MNLPEHIQSQLLSLIISSPLLFEIHLLPFWNNLLKSSRNFSILFAQFWLYKIGFLWIQSLLRHFKINLKNKYYCLQSSEIAWRVFRIIEITLLLPMFVLDYFGQVLVLSLVRLFTATNINKSLWVMTFPLRVIFVASKYITLMKKLDFYNSLY